MNLQDKNRESLSRRRFIKNGMIVGAATIAGSAACTNETCTRQEGACRDSGTGPGETSDAQCNDLPRPVDAGDSSVQGNDLPRPVADGEFLSQGDDLPRPVATKESIKAHALVADFWNPLWHDPDYAKQTRWGGITAAPMYLCPIVNVIPDNIDIQPDTGTGWVDHNFLGEDWDLFEPIYINDAFKIYMRSPGLKNLTPPDGDIPNIAVKLHDKDVYNQKNKMIAGYKLYADISILPEAPQVDQIEVLDHHVYTKEELEYIQDIIKQEEIRGADTRYWEDVNVGDETKPVALGPTTIWDMIAFCAGRQEFPFKLMRVLRETGGRLVIDPVTGVSHNGIEWHFVDRIAHLSGEVAAVQFGAFARQQMARLVTNWMGDDGFIKKFNWRHLKRTPIGDTFVGRGRVIDKRIENDEYLVDLDVWLENLCRGNVAEAAKVTVSIYSRNNPREYDGTTSIPQMAEFKIGDRVIIKDRDDWFPTGYQLANAEGTVIRLYAWVEVFEEFQEYIAVRIDKANTELGIGTDLMFRAESLEKI